MNLVATNSSYFTPTTKSFNHCHSGQSRSHRLGRPLGAASLPAHDGYTQRAAGAICAHNGQPYSFSVARRVEGGLEVGADVGRGLPESGQRGECAW